MYTVGDNHAQNPNYSKKKSICNRTNHATVHSIDINPWGGYSHTLDLSSLSFMIQ